MNELIDFARKKSAEHPNLAEEIWDIVQLCKDEINDGGSREHEIALAIESIKQLN